MDASTPRRFTVWTPDGASSPSSNGSVASPQRRRRQRSRYPTSRPTGAGDAASVCDQPTPAAQRHHGRAAPRDAGQATTEYALVLLGAALVGVLVIGWATSGGGAAAINRLFKAVLDSVISNV